MMFITTQYECFAHDESLATILYLHLRPVRALFSSSNYDDVAKRCASSLADAGLPALIMCGAINNIGNIQKTWLQLKRNVGPAIGLALRFVAEAYRKRSAEKLECVSPLRGFVRTHNSSI